MDYIFALKMFKKYLEQEQGRTLIAVLMGVDVSQRCMQSCWLLSIDLDGYKILKN